MLRAIVIVGALAAGQEAAPEEVHKPSITEEVQGTCETPREAMLQLLYWIQDDEDRVELDKAAACMDSAGLSADELEDRAFKLKRTLDVRGLYIDIDALPRTRNYKDESGVRRYKLPDLEQVEIVKSGDTWVFSAATVKRIPELYADTIPPVLDAILLALPDWFHSEALGIQAWQYLGIVVLLFIALALQKVVVYLVGQWVKRLAGRLRGAWIGKAVSRIDKPIGGLVMAAVLYVAFPWLQFSVRVSQVMRVATQMLAAYSVVWLAYRMIDVLTDWLEAKAESTASKLDDQLIPLLRKTLKVFVAVIGAIFILQNLDVDVGSLLAGLGLGGLAFALAAKDTVANFFGSLVIFIDRPFQIGDWVVIGGVEGVVEEVGFRTTKVRTFYNSLVTVPNAKMTDTSIDNYGLRKYRRYSTTIGITYDTPPERVQAFCEGVRAIIAQLPGMRKDYYMVEFKEFADFSLNIMLYCFMEVPDWAAEMRVRTNLNLEIMRLAEELGVSFAFPTRTLHIDSQVPPREPPERPAPGTDELKTVIHSYGPGGARALPRGFQLTHGYTAGDAPQKGNDDA